MIVAGNATPLEFERTLRGRRILVTGHGGFTGTWACIWLKSLGAHVAGYSLPPETTPSLSQVVDLDSELDLSRYEDILNFSALRGCFEEFRPELVLHLAAQPLVRRSYREPLVTFATNTLGTAHVLEASRTVPSVCAAVCVTTDKVYRNNEWPWPYRETDSLGGNDPYSSSKAAAEMVVESYRASPRKPTGTTLAIATARGGNIVGGGDWSEDRLVPDFVRAVTGRSKLTLRYPQATRPWQHVLALVQGYLMLLAALLREPATFSRAWNFGPTDNKIYSVRDVMDILSHHWERPQIEYMENPLTESIYLTVDSSLARSKLGWRPAWDTERVLRETAAWYRNYYRSPDQALSLTVSQLTEWRAALQEKNI
jgi:CDP-glucose 4,6-dehydratase